MNGERVARTKNVLTTFGGDMIARVLGEDQEDWGGAFMIGGAVSGEVTPATTSTYLAYPFLRFEHDEYGHSLSPTRLAKSIGTIPSTFNGVITEIGLYPQTQNGENSSSFVKLLDFTASTVDSGNWTSNTTQRRLGVESLKLSVSASGTDSIVASNRTFDLNPYNNNDDFTLAVYTEDSNLTSIVIDIKTDASNYFTHTISSFSVGWNLLTFKKSNFTSTGAPVWTNITELEFTANAGGGTAVVSFDGLILQDTQGTWNDYGLVSHALLDAPVTVTSGDNVQVEYELTVALG